MLNTAVYSAEDTNLKDVQCMPDRTSLSGMIKPLWGAGCCGGLQGEASLYRSRAGQHQGLKLNTKHK